MKNPLVSVVIPTYNNPTVLEATLASVFTQTFTDYEVIVVNDGSTDDTEQRLNKYGERIRVISQQNEGIGAARNRGMDDARGTYIAFLDHDDLWHPEKLAVQTAFMRRTPVCIASSVPFSYSSSPEICSFELSIRDRLGIVQQALDKLAAGHIFIQSSALMVEASKIAGIRYETEAGSFEDLPLQIRLILRGPFGIAGDHPLVIYRIHTSNASKSPNHFYRGISHLRQMERTRRFGQLTPSEKLSINKFISFFARISAVRQLRAGLRINGARLYFSELPHQLRHKRYRFLFLFPLAILLPKWAVTRLFRIA